MEEYILSFDPGKSSGIALGKITDDHPYLRVGAWQVEGGLGGLTRWVRGSYEKDFGKWWLTREGIYAMEVCEKFTPLQNKGFSLTLDSVEPLRCEGMLVAFDIMPDYPSDSWRRPDRQYLYGGDTKAEKRKLAKQFLKDHHMYLTGKQVGCKDAEDAISATLHGISYAAQVLKHKPTFGMITEWGDSQ